LCAFHRCEICFPPLTALEVRGTRIDGSVTVVEVDARVCQTGIEADADHMVAVSAFRGADGDGSGELDLKEFKRLALQLLPDVPDERLDEVFTAADQDVSGRIDFEEYRNVCIPMLKNEEVDVKKRREESLKATQAREIKQAEEFAEAKVRKQMEKALEKQRKQFNNEIHVKVQEEALIQRKSIADLAAEMLIGFGTDRTSLPGARSRKCAMLARAIEGQAFKLPAIEKEVKARKARSERRRARSQSPQAAAGASSTTGDETTDAAPAPPDMEDARAHPTTEEAAERAKDESAANTPSAAAAAPHSERGKLTSRTTPRSAGTPRTPRSSSAPRSAASGGTPRGSGGTAGRSFTPRLDLSEFTETPKYR
jgi:hypothetical protein